MWLGLFIRRRGESAMKAITLYQPWATLVAIRAKKIETRSWATAYRGPLAIHAGKSTEFLSLCGQEPYRSILLAHFGAEWCPSELPLGAVVATAELYAVEQMTPELIAATAAPERSFGLYEPGRFAWSLRAIRPLAEPAPARGYQMLWNWSAK